MTKHRAVWITTVLAGALVLLGGMLLYHALADTVTPENIDRVIPGMPLAHVEAVFGRRADEVAAASSPDDPYGRYHGPFWTGRWYGRERMAYFMFDAEDRVVSCGWGGVGTRATWYQRLVRRLGF